VGRDVLEGDEWKDSPKEGPEEHFARMELQQQQSDERAADNLIYSLTPADAHKPLIPWKEVKAWGLKRKRK
jgi:hypothetical protein